MAPVVGLSGLDTLGSRGLSLPSMCHRELSALFLVHPHSRTTQVTYQIGLRLSARAQWQDFEDRKGR